MQHGLCGADFPRVWAAKGSQGRGGLGGGRRPRAGRAPPPAAAFPAASPPPATSKPAHRGPRKLPRRGRGGLGRRVPKRRHPASASAPEPLTRARRRAWGKPGQGAPRGKAGEGAESAREAPKERARGGSVTKAGTAGPAPRPTPSARPGSLTAVNSRVGTEGGPGQAALPVSGSFPPFHPVKGKCGENGNDC
jgi:hypothetical protein